MKRILLTTIITATLIYAGDAAIELEHAIKTAPSVESAVEDMSAMKAMGKCGGDQKSKQPIHHQSSDKNISSAELELEHAIKTTPSAESPVEDMSAMKAMGKCGGDQKSSKPSSKEVETKGSAVPVEYEHALKSSSSIEGVEEDMSKMKAMGKCGGDK